MDYLLIIRSYETEIKRFKDKMKQVFEMIDLGKSTYFFGMEFLPTLGGIILHQAKYEKEFLTKFSMLECNTLVTPAETNLKLVNSNEDKKDRMDATTFTQLVGSLRYLCKSRPDIYYPVGLVSRFMNNPLK